MKKEPEDKKILDIKDKELFTLEVLIGYVRQFGINPGNAYIYVDHNGNDTGLYINIDIDSPKKKQIEEFNLTANQALLAKLTRIIDEAKKQKKKDKKDKDKK